jgi:hypothetical protein
LYDSAFSINNKIKIRDRYKYVDLLAKRAKYGFVQEQIRQIWLHDYNTKVSRNFIKKNNVSIIDSAYLIQKDSLRYKKWKPEVFVLGGISNTYGLFNKSLLEPLQLSTNFGIRTYLRPQMRRLSYFVDVNFSNHKFIHVYNIESKKYEVERFYFSTITLPFNISYKPFAGTKFLYLNGGVSPQFVLDGKYINSFRDVKIRSRNLYTEWGMPLNIGIGFHSENSKKWKSFTLNSNIIYYPYSILRDNPITSQYMQYTVCIGFKL